MNHRTVKVGLLALAIVLPGAAFANEPAPGSTEGYSGSLAELATGVRSTPPQPTTIQSPRDPASGQAMGDGSNSRSANPSQSDNFSLSSSTPGSTLVNNENLTSARGTETAQPGQFLSGGSGDGQGIKRKPPRNKNRKGKRMHKP